jgi:23S rRNA (uracil1939-C5)-methyltransferase
VLKARLGTSLQGLFWNGQPARSNAILGPHWQHIAGELALEEHIAGARVFVPAAAFMQNNPAVYERIVQRIGAWVGDGLDVLELYAGVGAIGLSCLPRAARVRFNELSAGSLDGLRMGLSALAPELAARAQVLPGRAGEQAMLLAQADVVIVDPPRKGLDAELLEALCSRATAPRELIYLSCGPAALIAEAERMQHALRLEQLVVFDLFPWTGHAEALARFARRG